MSIRVDDEHIQLIPKDEEEEEEEEEDDLSKTGIKHLGKECKFKTSLIWLKRIECRNNKVLHCYHGNFTVLSPI